MGSTFDTAAAEPRKKGTFGSGLQRLSIRLAQDRPLILIGLIVILSAWMAITYPESFPQRANIAAVLLDTAQGGILTVGMMILLVSGVFDLSVGAILAFCGIVAGTLVKDMGMPPFDSFLIGIAAGSAIGVINGLIITKLRINALITTLALAGILRGVTQLVASAGVANLPDGFRPYGQRVFLGLQSPFWVMTIRNFMLVFGLASSAFDVLTFVLLLGVLQVSPAEFRTAWFVESLLTEVAILLVVRTQRPLWRSGPSPMLLRTSLAVAALALALPFLPFARALFDFVPLSPPLTALLVVITLAYVMVNEAIKQVVGRRIHV